MGATLGMAAGLLVTFSYMTHTQPWLREWVLGISRSEPITLWWGIQPIAAGVFGAPVAFLTIIVVSLLTPPPDRATLALVDYLRQRGGARRRPRTASSGRLLWGSVGNGLREDVHHHHAGDDEAHADHRRRPGAA